MNAPTTIIEHPHFTDTTATSAQNHHTILTANRQAVFLKSLQLFGNVRLACRAACVSAQTAYRARRRSSGFALAWDAALVAARAHAEATLADRAINGVEEAVYYHGEEVARRRRYDSRLLLAHLARLDRLEEREEVAAALPQLDDWVEALEEGAGLDAVVGEAAGISSQDPVPPVPSCRNAAKGDEAEGDEPKGAEPKGNEPKGNENADLPPLERRLQAMEAARPVNAPSVYAQARGAGEANDLEPAELEWAQLLAFEAGEACWWEAGLGGRGGAAALLDDGELYAGVAAGDHADLARGPA